MTTLTRRRRDTTGFQEMLGLAFDHAGYLYEPTTPERWSPGFSFYGMIGHPEMFPNSVSLSEIADYLVGTITKQLDRSGVEPHSVHSWALSRTDTGGYNITGWGYCP